MNQLDRVLNLAERGFRLFPLSPLSKIPLKGTAGCTEATSDPGKLTRWYEANPKINWGIAGGRIEGNEDDYLIVIDVDTKEGKNGGAELDDIIAKYGPLPDTLKVKTCSGGYHFYFLTKIKKNRYRARFKGCEHIDIKSSGGYLVLWGCSTPQGRYHVESGHIKNLKYLEDWLGEATEDCITGSNKDYELTGTIDHGARWAFMTSWAGKLRSQGLKGESLFQALWDRKMMMKTDPDDRYNEEWVRKLANNYSTYPNNFPPTDQGNADRFVAAYQGQVKHAHQLGWFIWNGSNWERDAGEKAVLHYAGQLIQVINEEIGLADNKKLIKMLDKTRVMLSMNNSRKNALSLTKVSPLVGIDADAFDKSEYLFNVSNGVINLKNGELKKHEPDLLLSKISPIDYDVNASSPKFEKFLDEITCGDKDLALWIQTYFGYAMTANVSEQLFSVFYGTGGNGKSVLVNVVSTIMGQYTLETPVETIMYKRGGGSISNDIARIKGARLVTCRESDQGQALAESLIKSLTGGDKITARFLHKEFFEFKPVAKWILFTNHKPSIKGTDQGIWRRVKLIPFNYSVPDGKKNKNLEAELLNEAAGILNWLVEGCLTWQKNGFPRCEAIDNATSNYQQDEDRIGEFLTCAANMGPGPNFKTSASELYKAYRYFCREVGDMPMNSRNFPKKMEEKGHVKKRSGGGNFWDGISLTDEYKEILMYYDEKAVSF